MTWWDDFLNNGGTDPNVPADTTTPDNLTWPGDSSTTPDNLTWPGDNTASQPDQSTDPNYYNQYPGPWLPQYMPDQPPQYNPPPGFDPAQAEAQWAKDWGYNSNTPDLPFNLTMPDQPQGQGYDPSLPPPPDTTDTSTQGRPDQTNPDAPDAPPTDQMTAAMNAVNAFTGNAARGAGDKGYLGKLGDAITAPWSGPNGPYSAPDKQGMNPLEWIGDNAGRLAGSVGAVAGSALGAMGAGLQPVGGIVDAVADSGIPVVSQAAQLERGVFTNWTQPILGFSQAVVGDVLRGQGLSILENLNPFDSTDRDKTVSAKLGYVQDAYNNAIASGMTDDQASQVAQQLDRSLSNFANLTEYAGMQKFGTLPALAQLGFMLLDPVANTGGELMFAGRLPKALSEGRIAESSLGGMLGRTVDKTTGFERPTEIADIAGTANNALGYVSPFPVVGKVASALGDVTGLSGLLDRTNQGLQSPKQADNLYNAGAEKPIDLLNQYSAENPTIPQRDVIGEYLNNPDSPVYHEAIGAPQELTDYLKQAYDATPAEPVGKDSVFQPGEGKQEPSVSQLGQETQRTGEPTPEIQGLRENINTADDLAKARQADAANKPADVSPAQAEINAAMDASFKENFPGAPRPERVPLADKYQGVKVPTKSGTIDEFYGASRDIHAVDVGFKTKAGSVKGNPTLRYIKPMENLKVIGGPLRAWETLTHATFARPFLNSYSRLVRDPLGNLVKLGVQGPDTLAGYVVSHLTGGKDTTSQLFEKYGGKVGSTGHASASADVTYANGAKNPIAKLWYYASRPLDEGAALGTRLFGKAIGNKALEHFTPTGAIEKIEQNIKDYKFKRDYVRQFQKGMTEARRSGVLDQMAKQMGLDKVSPEVVDAFIAGKMPRGADLKDYQDNVYNPANFSPEVIKELNKTLVGDAGPMGDLLKQTFEQLGGLREQARQDIINARDKEVAAARGMGNKKAGLIREKTAQALASGKLNVIENHVGPDHPLVQKLWADAGKQVDNSFVSQAAVAVSEPKVVAAYKQAVKDQLAYIKRSGDLNSFRDLLEQDIRTHEPEYTQYQPKQPAPPATPSGAAAKVPVVDSSLKSEIAQYGKLPGRVIPANKALRTVEGKGKPGDVVVRYEKDGALHFRPTQPDKLRPGETVVWSKEGVAREAPGRTPVPDTTSGVDLPAIKARMQDYYEQFFKTGGPKPSYDFSANEVRNTINRGDNLEALHARIIEADAKLREITGNRFQLDLNTMTPIGRKGTSYAGQYLTELAGKGSPRGKIEPPLGKALPPEVKSIQMGDLLTAIKERYGDDALQKFSEMDPAKADAIHNEIAEMMLGTKPIDPLASLSKANKEWEEAQAQLKLAKDDMTSRYNTNKKANSASRDDRETLKAQMDKQANQLLQVRNRIAVKAHAAGYEGVKNSFFDYRNKNTVDQVLGSILPYQYWTRQNFAFAMRHFAEHPMHYAAVLNFYNTLEKENSDPNIPDYAKGNIFLWQNPDGSKVMWNFASVLPFNPLGENDTVMQVVSPGDSTGKTSRNTDPLSILIGTDIRNAKGAVIGREKGVLPSFFRPNPILELAFKTGNVNKILQAWGIAKGDQSLLGQDYSEANRKAKETSGILPGNTSYQELGAATGLTKMLRDAKLIPADLSPESLLNDRLFGQNAGKPQTKIYQELAKMAQDKTISAEQAKLAIAAYKSGNWTPEALMALDRVQGENAGRRLLTSIGFTTLVVNTPRQQNATQLYGGLTAIYNKYGGAGATASSGKGKDYKPSPVSQYYAANPGMQALGVTGKDAGTITQGVKDDKTRSAMSDLYQKSTDKTISARDFNLAKAKLKAENPAYFVAHPDKSTPANDQYREQLDQFNKLSGNYSALSKQAFDLSQSGDKAGAAAIYNSQQYKDLKAARDAFDKANPDFKKQYDAYITSKGGTIKTTDPAQTDYFNKLTEYNKTGGAAYDALSKQLSDAYTKGDKKAQALIYNNPVYQRGKAARDQYLINNPDFAQQYKDYLAGKGITSKPVDPNAPLTGTSKYPATTGTSTKKPFVPYSTAKSTFVPYTAAQKKAYAIAQNGGVSTSPAKSSTSSSGTAFTSYTPAQSAAYAKALSTHPGNLAYARAAAANTPPGGSSPTAPTGSSTALSGNSRYGGTMLGGLVIPNLPPTTATRSSGANTPTTSTYNPNWTQPQKQLYSSLRGQGKTVAYATAAANNLGNKTSLNNPIVKSNTIGYTNGGSGSPDTSLTALLSRYISSSHAGQATPHLPPVRSSRGSGGSRTPYVPYSQSAPVRFSPGSRAHLPTRIG